VELGHCLRPVRRVPLEMTELLIAKAVTTTASPVQGFFTLFAALR
jgi:hypothetical protein